jgi:hypothetical protein
VFDSWNKGDLESFLIFGNQVFDSPLISRL